MLDPDLQVLLSEMQTWPAPPPTTPETMWIARAAQYREASFGAPYEEVAEVLERVVEGRGAPIRVKVYTPRGVEGIATPAILRIHGGAMVLGSPEFEDRTSRTLANALGCRVFALAYRLAPEHPWPAGLHDCIDVLKWVHTQAGSLGVDAERLAVLGHSAGGLLALSCAIALRDTGPRVRRYLALEPVTGPGQQTASRTRYGDGALLIDVESLERCWAMYLAGVDPVTPEAAPARASEQELRGLDPISIITAEYDPLRDEGEDFARRLADAGVEVECRRFDGLLHGSINFIGRAPATLAVLEEIVRILRVAFDANDL